MKKKSIREILLIDRDGSLFVVYAGVRVRNAILRAGIRTVEDLLNMDPPWMLLRQPNFGRKSQDEVDRIKAEIGQMRKAG